MKKQKIKKEIVYDGLGFKLVLKNVPMIEIRGIWTLDIDLNVLQKAVLLALAKHTVDLTGHQVYFIRTWFGLTQYAFGQLFGITHSAIVKWEKAGNCVAKMNLTTQRDLRLWILDKLLTKDNDFRKSFKLIHDIKYSGKIELLKFDLSVDLVAI